MPLSHASTSGTRRLVPKGQASTTNCRSQPLAFAIVFLFGAMISWFVFFVVGRNHEQEARIEFEREANQLEAKLQSQFDLSIEYLLAIPPFYNSSDEVDQDEFTRFVGSAIKRHPGVYTFEYLERVPAAKRQSFDQEFFTIRAVDIAGETIELPQQDNYFPIKHGEPTIQEVLGIDLSSHPQQGRYVLKASDSDIPIATPPLSLIEDPDEVRSLIALAPQHGVSEGGTTTECVGIAVLILRIEPVIEAAIQDWLEEHFQLAIYDLDGEGSEGEVYKNFPGDEMSIPSKKWPVESLAIKFADRNWQLTVSPSEKSEYASSPPYWILLSGLALSALAAYSFAAALAIGTLRKQVDEARELGQYRLGKKLGQGGMGVVYEAEHRMLARPAAIKLIQLETNDSETIAASKQSVRLNRFEKEAKATAGLESPHTISVYDFGQTPDGKFYYVMELLQGTDLSTLVKEHGSIPQGRVIHLIRQACLSLAEAHAAGLIHRDIKPANIFVCHYAMDYDFVKVLDFGLVKSSSTEESVDITQPGSFIGTPAFVAPEMLLGEEVDARTDIYSLGCVMFWLLTGTAPFDAKTATAMMAKHLTEKPHSLRSILGDRISPQLDAIVLACLAKKPSDRPQSAQDLGQLLAACAADAPWTQVEAQECWMRESRRRITNLEHETHRDADSQATIAEKKIAAGQLDR